MTAMSDLPRTVGAMPELAPSVACRDELESLLQRDLLGPWDGPDEELRPGEMPAERYLVGRLVPRPADVIAAVVADDEADLADLGVPELTDRGADIDVDGGEQEVERATRSGSMAASAMGLSFLLPTDVETVHATPSWGRYIRRPSETAVTEQGRPRVTWHREPGGGRPVLLDVSADGTFEAAADDSGENITLHWTVRTKRTDRGTYRSVHVALVNDLPHPPSTPDVNRLYQVSLGVTAPDATSAIFVGHNDPELMPAARHSDPEKQHLELLHRRTRRFGTGSQAAVQAEVRDGDTRAWRLKTTSFPSVEIDPIVPAAIPGLTTDMTALGNPELRSDELVAALRPLVSGYRQWLQEQRAFAATDAEVLAYGDSATLALDEADVLADRLDRAIDLLRDDGLARAAFRFANQAMASQRVRSEVVRARTADPELTTDELLTRFNSPRYRSWRPFQLAFVLLCIPGLTDPAHPDAHRDIDDGQAQLLFFPTGGGKTEAYLGLTAYTLAIRRLQGVVGHGADAREGSDGVAVLMRYTLRLLTAQQFQRAASLIAACELLRQEHVANGDTRWGSAPFRLGMWVGGSVTPNSFDEARQIVEEAVGGDQGRGLLQLAACPWCGGPLTARTCLEADVARRRVLTYCADPDGRCPFTRRRAPGEGLPVVVVDEEIYRLTPALVIGTVDKFAQLPWRGGTAPLFGLVTSRCPRHGWQNVDTAAWCGSRHNATRTLPAVEAQASLRLRPPDLVIQDELHLISDALGSMVGLYETAIDRLASRPNGDRVIRPVLVASTATVRRARDQVRQVFDRGLAVFPPQAIDAGETFFSQRITPTAEHPGRRYRGICATGERVKSVAIRVFSSLLEHGQYLLDTHGAAADPYCTVAAYFSATKDLAGTRRLLDDDIAERLSRQRPLTARRRRPVVGELTSRMPSDRIGAALKDLERVFDPEYDSSAAMRRLRDDEEFQEASKARARPLDVLLATSMLQVGVDVQRLGLMVVYNQPKNMAEYIQASSRVGRSNDRPGLVLTLYNWSRPRDLAHFESFEYDHRTFGRHVEGVTTTPFSDRALDRALSAVLVTALRHTDAATLPDDAAAVVPRLTYRLDEVKRAVVERALRVSPDAAHGQEVAKLIQYRFESWAQQAANRDAGRLGYRTEPGIDRALLRRPSGEPWQPWTLPMSLREVEPEIALQVRETDASMESPPAWQYGETGGDD